MADLLTEAKAPVPRFAAVICEDIERSARDTFNALKLEKELSRQGVPLFATDEPASIEGINATTVLVRRVKQGVAEWYRLQLKEKAWKGLEEHALAGWNTGPAAYGYLAEKVPHPAPGKAAQGMTKSRLLMDPVRGPVVTQIFEWRVTGQLSIPAIVARLNADPAAYPALDCAGVDQADRGRDPGQPEIHRPHGLRPDPHHQHRPQSPARPPRAVDLVTPARPPPAGGPGDLGPSTAHRRAARQRPRPRDAHHPARTPVHPAIPDPLPDLPAAHARHRTARPHREDLPRLHLPTRPRQPPPHRRLPRPPPRLVREDTLITALAGFFDQYIFGHDRAALLAALLPATDAGHAEAQARKIAHLHIQLRRIDTAERGLISELEAPADPGDPAAAAYRARIRARYAELYTERTSTETDLAALQATATPDNDPTLLDELPTLAGALPGAPDRIKQALLTAFDINALYNKDDNQVTIWATITGDTPALSPPCSPTPHRRRHQPARHPAHQPEPHFPVRTRHPNNTHGPSSCLESGSSPARCGGRGGWCSREAAVERLAGGR